MPNALLIIVILTVSIVTTIARADVFVFTDSNGITYFSNVPVDGRYEILIKSEGEIAPGKAIVNPNMLKKSFSYNPIIEQAATNYDMDSALLRAVIVVESGFNERAESSAGAQGLMQLMPATAEQYGVSDTFDPTQNINAGAQHLSELIKRYENDLELALAAYNAGESAVERYGRQVPPFAETRRYVPKVIKIYNSLLALDQRT